MIGDVKRGRWRRVDNCFYDCWDDCLDNCCDNCSALGVGAVLAMAAMVALTKAEAAKPAAVEAEAVEAEAETAAVV